MKQALTSNWRDVPFAGLPDLGLPLAEAWAMIPVPDRAGAKLYRATLAANTQLAHEVDVLWLPALNSGFVTWNGPGTKADVVVRVEGAIERIKRQCETYKISSVPAFRPLRSPISFAKKAKKPAKRVAVPRETGRLTADRRASLPLTNISKS